MRPHLFAPPLTCPRRAPLNQVARCTKLVAETAALGLTPVEFEDLQLEQQEEGQAALQKAMQQQADWLARRVESREIRMLQCPEGTCVGRPK